MIQFSSKHWKILKKFHVTTEIRPSRWMWRRITHVHRLCCQMVVGQQNFHPQRTDGYPGVMTAHHFVGQAMDWEHSTTMTISPSNQKDLANSVTGTCKSWLGLWPVVKQHMEKGFRWWRLPECWGQNGKLLLCVSMPMAWLVCDCRFVATFATYFYLNYSYSANWLQQKRLTFFTKPMSHRTCFLDNWSFCTNFGLRRYERQMFYFNTHRRIAKYQHQYLDYFRPALRWGQAAIAFTSFQIRPNLL